MRGWSRHHCHYDCNTHGHDAYWVAATLQAFGTIGAVEAAYFRETGKQLLLSEQDLMDCGWYKNNKACFGGYQVSCLLHLPVCLLTPAFRSGWLPFGACLPLWVLALVMHAFLLRGLPFCACLSIWVSAF